MFILKFISFHLVTFVLNSELESQEDRDTCADPVVFFLVRRQLQERHEVGRVTRRGQRARSRQHLIQRCVIEPSLRNDPVLDWDHVDHRHLDEKLLGIALVQHVGGIVPLASFDVAAIHEAAYFGLLLDLIFSKVILDIVPESDTIDSYDLLSGVVLHSASQESLWEKESGNPVNNGRSVPNPFGKEIDSFIAVNDPRCEWLHRQETVFSPHGRHLVVVDRRRHLFEFLRHHDLTDKRLLHRDELIFHVSEQAVVTYALLEEHSVH
jgi:hypothetical protein